MSSHHITLYSKRYRRLHILRSKDSTLSKKEKMSCIPLFLPPSGFDDNNLFRVLLTRMHAFHPYIHMVSIL